MALKEKIQEDLKESLKEKEELKSLVLRMVIASILNKEKEKRYKLSKEKPDSKDIEKESQLMDEEIINVISTEIKKRNEAVAGYEKGGRKEQAEKEKKETEILQKYLPEQISESELKKLVQEAIDKVGAKEQKDMGKVMAELMPKVRGKADGSLISKVVKELLVPKSNS